MLAAVVGVTVALLSATDAATTVSLWSAATRPAVAAYPDLRPVEVGVRFTTSVPGWITGIRFYKGVGNSGTHTGTLWSPNGAPLATGTFTDESTSGWQTLHFAHAVGIRAGLIYVASYHAPEGHYAVTEGYFHDRSVVNGPLRAPSTRNGVYQYGSTAFPADTYDGDNDWVDVLFTPGAAPPQSQTRSSAPASAISLPSARTPAALAGSGVKLREVDGGPHYYAKFSPSLPDSPSFFPIGVWFESVLQPSDIDSDKAAEINTYVQLTDNSNLNLVRKAGMYVISRNTMGGYGSETVGWLVSDEADMWGGPGTGAWTGNSPGNGNICSPPTTQCGYTVQQTELEKLPHDGRLRYSNYGKGVTFWETDAEAARFVNDFQDVVSADNYWLTDEDICSASQGGKWFNPNLLVSGGNGAPGQLPLQLCHRASNYGLTVDRLRALISPRGSKPVWAFVEVGHPFTQNDWPSATPQQVVAAVWNSIIAGARGIIYFNHSFGGPCQTQHALRDSCYAAVRAAVTRVDSQIKALAPVLNAPFADGVVTASSGVDISTKWYRGHFYLLAASNEPRAQEASFSMRCVGSATVTVLNENRTLRAADGVFTDRFVDSNAVHIYRIDGGSNCGT
jgi:hypothetical protein